MRSLPAWLENELQASSNLELSLRVKIIITPVKIPFLSWILNLNRMATSIAAKRKILVVSASWSRTALCSALLTLRNDKQPCCSCYKWLFVRSVSEPSILISVTDSFTNLESMFVEVLDCKKKTWCKITTELLVILVILCLLLLSHTKNYLIVTSFKSYSFKSYFLTHIFFQNSNKVSDRQYVLQINIYIYIYIIKHLNSLLYLQDIYSPFKSFSETFDAASMRRSHQKRLNCPCS